MRKLASQLHQSVMCDFLCKGLTETIRRESGDGLLWADSDRVEEKGGKRTVWPRHRTSRNLQWLPFVTVS